MDKFELLNNEDTELVDDVVDTEEYDEVDTIEETDLESEEVVSEDAQIIGDPYNSENLPKSLNHLVDGYMDYAKEVILERALPGIDGFKPSQRRILYAMKYLEKDTDLTKDLTKCAGIAGTTMKIHPHGDASIYETMVRMTDCAMY